jgi:hypothetical protein
MPRRGKLLVRMEPGSQYRGGVRMKDLTETNRQRLRYLPRHMFYHFMMRQ